MIAGGGIPLALTTAKYKKIGNTHDINISATRVKQGGFLPALLAALPVVASVLGEVGGLGGATSIIKNVKEITKGKGAPKRKKRGVGISLVPSI